MKININRNKEEVQLLNQWCLQRDRETEREREREREREIE